MPRISNLPAGVATVDETELIALVQNAGTVQVPLSDALAKRQPKNAQLDALAVVATVGFFYRNPDGSISYLTNPGDGIYEPVGTTAAAIAAHNADAGAHPGTFDTAGTAAAEVAAHEAATNVHDMAAVTGLEAALDQKRDHIIIDQTAVTPHEVYPAGDGTDERLVLVDATVGAFSVTIPAITEDDEGNILHIKKTDATANVITITPGGTDVIDGAATFALTAQYQSVTLIAKFDLGGNSFWSIV